MSCRMLQCSWRFCDEYAHLRKLSFGVSRSCQWDVSFAGFYCYPRIGGFSYLVVWRYVFKIYILTNEAVQQILLNSMGGTVQRR